MDPRASFLAHAPRPPRCARSRGPSRHCQSQRQTPHSPSRCASVVSAWTSQRVGRTSRRMTERPWLSLIFVPSCLKWESAYPHPIAMSCDVSNVLYTAFDIVILYHKRDFDVHFVYVVYLILLSYSVFFCLNSLISRLSDTSLL